MAGHTGGTVRVGKVRSMKSCIEKARARGVKDPKAFCRTRRAKI